MRYLLKFLISLIWLIIFLIFYRVGKFEKLELLTYDWRLKYSTLKENLPLVIIGITSDFEKEIGETFSRKHYSKILKILKEEKAQIVVFDIFFPTFSSENKDDLEFLNAIKENGKVILPVFSPVKLTKKVNNVYVVDSIRGSAFQFENFAFSLGHINTYQDRDQIVRKFPAYIEYKGRIYPQIGIEVKKILNKKYFLSTKKKSIPVDKDGCFYIRFISPDLIKKYFISFSDVLKKNYEKDSFNGKIVIIGQTIVGAKNADLIPTPFGTQFGVLVQASAIGTNISGMYIKHVFPLFYIIIYAFILPLIFSSSKNLLNTLYTLGLSFAIILVSRILMSKFGIFFDIIPFLFFTIFYNLSFIFYSFFQALKKLFQKEAIIKLLKETETEFAEILNPVELFRKEEMSFLGFGSEELIEKTPSMVLKTILLSTGIEAGCIVSKMGGKVEIIAKEGEKIDKLDIEEILNEVNSLKIVNKTEDKNIRNFAVIPVFSFPNFKVYGIFVNKNPTLFSKTKKFTTEDINLIETLTVQGIIAIQNAQLNLILKNAQLETIIRLAIAVEYRDRETGAHIHRVCDYAYLISEKLGLKKTECNLIKNAMPLHDIGKIAIPDNILLKPGKLTEEERKIVERHPIIGAKMLEGSNSIVLKAAEIIALSHHEKYDGTGYPYGLSGNKIPLYGRIATLADVFDALTTKRIYKEPVSLDYAFEIINTEKGKTFDPKIAEVFLNSRKEVIEIHKGYEKEKFFEL